MYLVNFPSAAALCIKCLLDSTIVYILVLYLCGFYYTSKKFNRISHHWKSKLSNANPSVQKSINGFPKCSSIVKVSSLLLTRCHCVNTHTHTHIIRVYTYIYMWCVQNSPASDSFRFVTPDQIRSVSPADWKRIRIVGYSAIDWSVTV